MERGNFATTTALLRAGASIYLRDKVSDHKFSLSLLLSIFACWLPNSPIIYRQNGVTAGQISEVRAAEEKSKRKWYKLLVKSSHKRMSDLLRKHGEKTPPVITVSLTYNSCNFCLSSLKGERLHL